MGQETWGQVVSFRLDSEVKKILDDIPYGKKGEFIKSAILTFVGNTEVKTLYEASDGAADPVRGGGNGNRGSASEERGGRDETDKRIELPSGVKGDDEYGSGERRILEGKRGKPDRKNGSSLQPKTRGNDSPKNEHRSTGTMSGNMDLFRILLKKQEAD